MLHRLWFKRIDESFEAFKQQRFADACLYLQAAFAQPTDYKQGHTRMDRETFNALLDVAYMLELIANFPCIEKNVFLEHIYTRLRTLTRAFARPKAGDWATLVGFCEGILRQTVEGLCIITDFLQKQGLAPTDAPPLLVFELTATEQIRLYGWTNTDESDPEAYAEEQETILLLAELFQAYFKPPPPPPPPDYISQAERLLAKKSYEAAIETLTEACRVDKKQQKNALLLMIEAYIGLGRYRIAAEQAVKAEFLGVPRKALKKNMLLVCERVLETLDEAKDPETFEHWLGLSRSYERV